MSSEIGTDPVAAVDLGSNSFHMIIARFADGHLQVLDRLREQVQLGAGLTAERFLEEEAQRRALRCLERFGQRLREIRPDRVRAVGTNALREAVNAAHFLARARVVLGHPIEVVPGREEARLVYLGVAHSLADDDGTRRLVVDIGGGSTECIIGERFDPIEADSLHMGCVSASRMHFPDGRLTREAFHQAELAAGLELRAIRRRYRQLGWTQSIGSSGTINAIDEILRANGWSVGGITLHGLKRLRKALIAKGHVAQLELPGLGTERASVLAGGVAILIAIVQHLRVDVMTASPGALREGLVYDLLGRIRHEDIRDRAIQRLVEIYQVDVDQAARVERTALSCLDEVARGWGLELETARHFLAWAARLHEIGLALSHSGYHKHGAYLIENTDLAGFSRDDRQLLAALVRGHRRKATPEIFAVLPPARAEQAERLSALLRLAVVLNRGRTPRAAPRLTFGSSAGRLVLSFPEGWLADHPLTWGDLEREAPTLEGVGLRLALE